MKYLLLAGALLCALFASDAQARQRTYAAHPDCNGTGSNAMPCQDVAPSARGERVRKAMGGLGSARNVYTPRISAGKNGTNIRSGRRSVVRDSLTTGEPRQHSVEGRPAGCPARAWCGCWLAAHLGISNRSLWLARNWASVGHPAGGPQPGAIVVWRHHVGTIKAVEGGRILVLSGNDGRAVRERWRTTAGVIAYRVPG
jgi:hypothetical protein